MHGPRKPFLFNLGSSALGRDLCMLIRIYVEDHSQVIHMILLSLLKSPARVLDVCNAHGKDPESPFYESVISGRQRGTPPPIKQAPLDFAENSVIYKDFSGTLSASNDNHSSVWQDKRALARPSVPFRRERWQERAMPVFLSCRHAMSTDARHEHRRTPRAPTHATSTDTRHEHRRTPRAPTHATSTDTRNKWLRRGHGCTGTHHRVRNRLCYPHKTLIIWKIWFHVVMEACFHFSAWED